MVMMIVVVFAILNPLVIPFAWIYFCVENGSSYICLRRQERTN
jgi:hypothetical protein